MGLLRFGFFCGEGAGGIGYGDSVGSVYADCVDYEVRRREVGSWVYRLGVGDVVMWIVYYCI